MHFQILVQSEMVEILISIEIELQLKQGPRAPPPKINLDLEKSSLLKTPGSAHVKLEASFRGTFFRGLLGVFQSHGGCINLFHRFVCRHC